MVAAPVDVELAEPHTLRGATGKRCSVVAARLMQLQAATGDGDQIVAVGHAGVRYVQQHGTAAVANNQTVLIAICSSARRG